MVPTVVAAMENKPRIPVIWLHGLECTCCSESFIRSPHPIVQDIVLNMISLDYDDTLQAAAGIPGGGDPPEADARTPRRVSSGGGRQRAHGAMAASTARWAAIPFLNILLETAEHAKAIIAWGSCASNGCVQAAHPNPTGAKPVHELLPGRAVINVPGCPPIAEVMTGVLTYILTFGALPELDRSGPSQDVLRATHPRQVRPPGVLRCRPLRGSLGRRRRAQRLVPLQDGLPRPGDLQFLRHHQVERRRLVPHRLRPWLPGVQRGQASGTTIRFTSVFPLSRLQETDASAPLPANPDNARAARRKNKPWQDES